MPARSNAQHRAHVELGRLLTRIEQGTLGEKERERLHAVSPGPSRRVGITGSPGVGKSSLVNHLIAAYRRQNQQVGVVAVDPTSPFSGGAVLGDRLRFNLSGGDDGVFIRSLASRGSLGGVAPAASLTAAALEGAGFENVLIETVGVGQTGYDIICLADTVVALFSPESGDAIQLLKAGILEVGDIYVVNKSDRPGAELLLREIRLSLDQSPDPAELRHHGPGQAGALEPPTLPPANWIPPVLPVNSLSGSGVEEVMAAITSHQSYLDGLGPTHPRRARRVARELAFVLQAQVSAALEARLGTEIAELAADVIAGNLSQLQAIEQLRSRFRIN